MDFLSNEIDFNVKGYLSPPINYNLNSLTKDKNRYNDTGDIVNFKDYPYQVTKPDSKILKTDKADSVKNTHDSKSESYILKEFKDFNDYKELKEFKKMIESKDINFLRQSNEFKEFKEYKEFKHLRDSIKDKKKEEEKEIERAKYKLKEQDKHYKPKIPEYDPKEYDINKLYKSKEYDGFKKDHIAGLSEDANRIAGKELRDYREMYKSGDHYINNNVRNKSITVTEAIDVLLDKTKTNKLNKYKYNG